MWHNILEDVNPALHRSENVQRRQRVGCLLRALQSGLCYFGVVEPKISEDADWVVSQFMTITRSLFNARLSAKKFICQH